MATKKYKVLQEFEHYPADVDPKAPLPVIAAKGDSVSNIHPDSIDGLLSAGIIEEVGSPKVGE